MSRSLPDDLIVLAELREELTVSIRLHQQVVSLAGSCLRHLNLANQVSQAGPDDPLAGLLEHFGRLAEEYSALACNEARPRAETAVRRHLMEYLSDADQAQHQLLLKRSMGVFLTMTALQEEYRGAKAAEALCDPLFIKVLVKLAEKRLEQQAKTGQPAHADAARAGLAQTAHAEGDEDEDDDDEEPTAAEIYDEMLRQAEVFMGCGDSLIELMEGLRRDVQRRLTAASQAESQAALGDPSLSEWDRMNCNQRMFAVLAGDRELYQNPASWWAEKVDCDASTVKKTEAWEYITTERAREQQRRRG